MLNRFIIDPINHCLEDRIEETFFYSKDQAYVHIANVLYNELQEVKELLPKRGKIDE